MPRKLDLPDIVEALTICEEDFLRRHNVVAIAAGVRTVKGKTSDELCVKTFVLRKIESEQLGKDELLPKEVKINRQTSVPVDVEEMAPPWAFGLRARTRPATGGYSVAHYQVTAGTIATVVRDRHASGTFYLLSNNHVLANSNTARSGDPILQPGPADGGTYPRDILAYLCRFVPIDFASTSSNLVDAAVACISFGQVERRVYGIGYPQAVRRQSGVHLGEELHKVGRTTEYTRGQILALHGIVDVNYGMGRVARFRDQIITSNMSAGGDSGSLVLDLDTNALGLLFAGSSTHTIVNHIEKVQDLLGIVVAEKVV